MKRFFSLLLFFVLGIAVVVAATAFFLTEKYRILAFEVSVGINLLLLAVLYISSSEKHAQPQEEAPKVEKTSTEEFEG